MLRHLLIKNYTLIEQLELSPSPLFNVITGETGAGKSIMLGALGLLLGKRADTKVLSHKEQKCIIEGQFEVGPYALKHYFEDQDLDYDDLTTLRREISPSGKSRAFVNDTPVTLDVMKELGRFLVDIHSQHDNLQLGSNKYQLNLLDLFGQHPELLSAYQQDFKTFQQAEKEYREHVEESAALKREADFNEFQWKELDGAGLLEGEEEQLEEELKTLEHAEEIKQGLHLLLQVLSESEASTEQSILQAITQIAPLSGFNTTLESVRERLESAKIEVRDIADTLHELQDKIEFDPGRLAEVNDRLSLLYKLQQKHGVSNSGELIRIREELDAKTRQVLSLDEDLETRKKAMEAAEKGMLSAGESLREARAGIIPEFQGALEEQLARLGMKEARVMILLNPDTPSASGLDKASILFTANKGVEPRPLKEVASGGEFSRLMFSIKYLIADKTALPTMIFDEIDTGISGEVAHKMADMMNVMAGNHQVISISHLPQLAAKANAHYLVFKDHSEEQSVSRLKELTKDDRVMEIAKMIGGERPSDIAFENARELMN